MATWTEQILASLLCPGTADNSTQINNFITLQKLNRLLAINPAALNADTSENNALKFFQNSVNCGSLFEIFQLLQYEAIIEYKLAQFYTTADQLIASGIYTSTGTTTTQNIPASGVVATDSVYVTLHTQAGSELVVRATAGANIITVVFSAAPTTATKVNWAANRPR